MSDNAATETAPAAPAEAAPEAPATEPASPQAPAQPAEEAGKSAPWPKPLSKREARRQMHAEHSASREAGEDAGAGDEGGRKTEVNAAGRKVDAKTKRYVPEGEEEEAPTDDDTAEADDQQVVDDEGGEETPAAEGERPDREPPTAADETRPEGTLEPIPIDESHPIREMGLDAFTPANELEDQAIRALLNGTYVRRQEVENVRGRAQEQIGKLTEQNRELQQKLLRIEASAEAQEEWQKSERYQHHRDRYIHIRDTVGKEEALAYWRSPDVQTELVELTDKKFEERWSEVEEREMDEASLAWADQQFKAITPKLPTEITSMPEYRQWFAEGIRLFDAELTNGAHDIPAGDVKAMNEQFAKTLTRHMLTKPAVRQAWDEVRNREGKKNERTPSAKEREAARKRELEAARKEGAEKARKEAAETRRDTPPNPLGALSDATRGDDAVVAGAEAARPEDTGRKSVRQLKREQKAAARQDARRRLRS